MQIFNTSNVRNAFSVAAPLVCTKTNTIGHEIEELRGCETCEETRFFTFSGLPIIF